MMKCNASLYDIVCACPAGHPGKHMDYDNGVAHATWDNLARGAKPHEDRCCDAADLMAGFASSNPASDALHRPHEAYPDVCWECGTRWPCRTAKAVGVGEGS